MTPFEDPFFLIFTKANTFAAPHTFGQYERVVGLKRVHFQPHQAAVNKYQM